MYWLSFGDERTGKNLGCCVVEAANMFGAKEEAWRLGINPGGQVLGVKLAPEDEDYFRKYMNRLLTKEEAEAVIEGRVN